MVMEHPSRFAATDPDRAAVIVAGPDHVLTYGELEARSNQVAHLLRALGLGVGDHVALVMDNCARVLRGRLGRAALRHVRDPDQLAPLGRRGRLRGEGLRGARRSFATAACAGIVPEGGAVRFVVGGGIDGFEGYEAAIGTQPTTPIDDECEGNWMFYSSGTTGRPKGIKPPGVGGPIGAAERVHRPRPGPVRRG